MTHLAADDGNHSRIDLALPGRKQERAMLKNRDPVSAFI